MLGQSTQAVTSSLFNFYEEEEEEEEGKERERENEHMMAACPSAHVDVTGQLWSQFFPPTFFSGL